MTRSFSTITRTALCLVVVLCHGVALAGTVTLAWDANVPAPDGYRVYARTADGYPPAPLCDTTETTCTVDVVDDRQTAFVATAYLRGGIDGAIIESGHSNEVVHTPASMAPETPRGMIIRALKQAWKALTGVLAS